MPVSTFNYSEDRIKAEHNRLLNYHNIGNPIDYEIKVDGVKAVLRTSDPSMFPTYETFVDENTRKIEVILYTGSSHYNDRHIYLMKPEPTDKGLGEIEINEIVEDALRKEREAVRYQRLEEDNQKLRDEIKELEGEIKDLENDITELEKEKAALQSSLSPLNGVLGEVGSHIVENFIKRNPKILKGLPGGASLSGLLGPDESAALNPSDASFESFSEDDQQAIRFMQEIQRLFNEEEIAQVVEIIMLLSHDKSKIKSIKEQLKQ